MSLLDWCQGYQDWLDACDICGCLIKANGECEWVDRVPEQAELFSYISAVEMSCRLTAGDRWQDLLLSVTEGIPEHLFGFTSHDIQTFLVFLSRKLQVL